MTNRREGTQDEFVLHGMNRLLHPLAAKFQEPLTLINYDSTTRFAKARRTGYSKYLDNPDNKEVYAIYPFTYTVAGVNITKVLRFSGPYIYVITLGSSPAPTSWGAPIYTFAADPTGVSLETFQNRLLIASVNGANGLLSYDGTSFYAEPSTPTTAAPQPPINPHYIAEYANRLRTGNDTSTTSAVKSSAVLYGATPAAGASTVPYDGHQWDYVANDPSTARYFVLSPDVAGGIIGIKKVHDKLAVWKGSPDGKQAMYRLSDPGTGYLTPQQIPSRASIRPNGERTIHLNEFGDCFFANDKGIYLYDGNRARRQSLALGSLYTDIAFTPKAAIDFEMRYLVSASASVTIDANTARAKTLTNPILIFDYQANEFYFYDTAHRMSCFTSLSQTASGSVQIYSGSTTGQCYVWDGSFTDDGVAIQGLIETRFFYGQGIYNDMIFNQMHAYAEGSGQQISFRPYEKEMFLEAVDINDGLTSVPLPTDLTRTKAVAYQVTTMESGKPPKWYGLSLWYEELTPGAD